MGYDRLHRLPKRIMSGAWENAGQHWPGGKEKERTDYVAEDRRVFGIKADWSTAALEPGAWYNAGLWPRGRGKWKKAFERRKTEEVDKVEVAPVVTVESLRRFKSRLDWIDPRTPGAASVPPIWEA